MRKVNLVAFLILSYICSIAQPNCNVFLWEGDTTQYTACKLSEKFNDYYQFDMKGLAILDSVLSICPHYADANYEYGVVYLKAGNFIGWNKYINKAVKQDAVNYLGLRASCRGKFFADYAGAIHDIDSLASILTYDVGSVHNGTYHLNIYKALCYKAMGEYDQAISIFEKHLEKNQDDIGLFDYIHLGVAHREAGNHAKAIECFMKQIEINDLAENNYYLAQIYYELGNLEKYNLYYNIAELKLKSDQKMIDGYHVMEDEVFESDLKDLKMKARDIGW